MKNLCFATLLALAVFFTNITEIPAQEFTELNTRQMGDNISLVYSIENERIGQLFNVQPYYSVDGQSTYRPMNTVWGNVGTAVKGGKNQLFVWDVLEDLNGLQGDVTFKLEARPHSIEPLEEEVSDIICKLISLHRIDNNQLELHLRITNTGEKRDLKIFKAPPGQQPFSDIQELDQMLASISSTANWMANSQIRDYIGAIKSRHTLLIADACFSGGIFQQRKTFEEATDQIDRVYTRPSRKAMTSGNLSEVPDKSIFLESLVNRLEENTRTYIQAEELFSSLQPVVVSQTSTEPQYGDIKGTGDEGGDFVFIKRECHLPI